MADATHHDGDHHGLPPFPTAAPDVSGIRWLSILAAVIGFGVFGVLGAINLGLDEEHGLRTLFTAYLCGFVFWCSLPFGSLLLSMIGFQMQASWGVVFRRIFQASLRTLPVLFVLGAPVIVSVVIKGGKDSPFWWSNQGRVIDSANLEIEAQELHAKVGGAFHDARDTILRGRAGSVAESFHGKDNYATRSAAVEDHHKITDYLNPTFFTVQYAVIFAVLGFLALRVHALGRKGEDTDDPQATADARGLSGPGIVVFVLLMTFFCTQWVMSVEPTWASSMFPVVFGMNMLLTTFAFCTLIFYTLALKGDSLAIVKQKFRIDIGTLTLGFCMVWAYASFCQYMLVWAGNLPEELTYYRKRGGGDPNDSGWLYLSYFLMAFHWLVPFITLLIREVKTNPVGMRIMAVLFLTVCACDVVWWIMPNVEYKTYFHVPMAFGAILGVGGLWGWVFCGQLNNRPLLPSNHEARFLQEWGTHH